MVVSAFVAKKMTPAVAEDLAAAAGIVLCLAVASSHLAAVGAGGHEVVMHVSCCDQSCHRMKGSEKELCTVEVDDYDRTCNLSFEGEAIL